MNKLDVGPQDKLRFNVRALLHQYSTAKKNAITEEMLKELGINIHGLNFIIRKTFSDSCRIRPDQLEIMARHLGVTVDELYATPPEGSLPENLKNSTYVR